MTLGNAWPEDEGQEAMTLPLLPVAPGDVQNAQRVRSVTPALSLPHAVTRPASQSGDSASPVPGVMRALKAALILPEDLVNARPKSLAQARGAHKAAAAQWNAPLARWPREAWGWLHLALKAAVHALDWVTESVIRTLVAAVIVALACIWL